MAASALIDAGALLALLDRTDGWHLACAKTLPQLRLPLATSEAVLTELFHLIGDSTYEMEAAWKLMRLGVVVLLPIQHAELDAIHALMSRYADRPMDFADATLVYLAKREDLSTVSPSITTTLRPTASRVVADFAWCPRAGQEGARHPLLGHPGPRIKSDYGSYF